MSYRATGKRRKGNGGRAIGISCHIAGAVDGSNGRIAAAPCAGRRGIGKCYCAALAYREGTGYRRRQ